MNRAFTIARREYVANVTRWEFLLLTFGFPLLGLFVGLLATLPVMLMARMVPGHLTVGIVDETGMFDFPEEIKGGQFPGLAGKLAPPQTAYTMRRLENRDQAAKALADHSVALSVIVPSDYLQTGQVITKWAKEGGLFSKQSLPPMRGALIRGLLNGRVEERIIQRVLEPMAVKEEAPVAPTRGRKQGPLAEMGELVVPYGFMVLMMMSIFVSSGYLLRGISDEKEGRIIEVVLSSVSAHELFVGKLVGLSAVGLTQVAVWLALGVVPAMMFLSFLDIRPVAVLLAPAFFLLGFLLYGALMAGIGALGGSWRESQQLSAAVSLFVVLPVMFFPVLLEAPDGPLAVWLSLFPFSAPLVMMIRLSATAVPWWQVALSLVLLAACIWVAIRLSVRLFRTAMLMYGKRPSLVEVWRWLREA